VQKRPSREANSSFTSQNLSAVCRTLMFMYFIFRKSPSLFRSSGLQSRPFHPVVFSPGLSIQWSSVQSFPSSGLQSRPFHPVVFSPGLSIQWSSVQAFPSYFFNPLNPELNPICYLLALLGAHHFLHVSRIRVKLLTFRRLISYIYGAPILDVSRSHTTTQHSR